MSLPFRTRRYRNTQPRKHSPLGLCWVEVKGASCAVAMGATPALSLRVEGSRRTKVQGQTSAADPNRGDSPTPRKSLDRHHAGPAGQAGVQDRATLMGRLGK